jgi:uracil-DNA glycosylase family 4
MKTPSDPQTPSLFGDLSAVEPLSWRETISGYENDSLASIYDDLKNHSACAACKPGMPLVFGVGAQPATLMLIGEGPGIDDIETEKPFQGQAGMLLTKMLAAIDVNRADCYICNVIKCVPPGERKFSVDEIEGCRPFLLRQILVVNPQIILAFGALAAQTLLRSKKTISDLRGQVCTLRLNDREIKVVPAFNPAYLLRVPEKKREAWEDLKLVRSLLRSQI